MWLKSSGKIFIYAPVSKLDLQADPKISRIQYNKYKDLPIHVPFFKPTGMAGYKFIFSWNLGLLVIKNIFFSRP